MVWLSSPARLAHAAAHWLLHPPVAVWFQRLASAALVGLGASTAFGF